MMGAGIKLSRAESSNITDLVFTGDINQDKRISRDELLTFLKRKRRTLGDAPDQLSDRCVWKSVRFRADYGVVEVAGRCCSSRFVVCPRCRCVGNAG